MEDFNSSLENSTQSDQTLEYDWIFPVSVSIILMVATLWILISLLHYGIKTKKWSQTQNNTDALSSGLIYGSVIACTLSCILRYTVSLALMNVGFKKNEDELCDSLADAAYAAYAAVLCFVAMFLWFRQQAFYANRMLNVNYNKIIKFFSYVSIVFIVAYGIFVIALNTYPDNYKSGNNGCFRSHQSTQDWIAAVVGVAFYNIVLLGLLSYALTHIQLFQRAQCVKLKLQEIQKLQQLQQKELEQEQQQEELQKQWQQQNQQQVSQPPQDQQSSEAKNANNNNINKNVFVYNQHDINCDCAKMSSSRFRSRRGSISASKIKTVLQKTLIFAIFSIIIDIFIQVFANLIVNPGGHRRITNMFFDISAFFNLLFVILSFAGYKEMLTSPCGIF